MSDNALLGCTLKDLNRFSDDRGWLVPVWSAEDFDARYMYYSWTHLGKCRDKDRWHVHQYHTDRFVVLHGNLLIALSNGMEMIRLALSGRHPQLLSIPPGILHCFKNCWHRDSLMCNLPSKVYDASDEGRVPFSELEVGHPW